MNRFNILDRNENIHRSRFLEASAGTGKTFTIEHLVCRLLIEQPQIPLNQILVVTFTRAATRDLKVRIRKCLEKAVGYLKSNADIDTPDYLAGISDRDNAIKLLSEAIFGFDDAQIFTIHGFCARALKENTLEGDVSLDSVGQETPLDNAFYIRIIQDYFRSGKALQNLGSDKLNVLFDDLGRYSNIEKELLRDIKKRIDFETIHDPEKANQIYSEVARQCRDLCRNFLSSEELSGPDELLDRMVKATENSAFRDNLRSKYSAAIIDEFQDTDPDQWTIFERLFLNDVTMPVYLVGDPKQSIYAFRQADIYTYLKAGHALGLEARASLDTNYRSSPSLIHALNVLFDKTNIPNFMPLPRLAEDLKYAPVNAPPKGRDRTFKDKKGSIHFVSYSKDDHLYQFIANEIVYLNTHESIPFKEIVILVKSKVEGEEIKTFLKSNNIPAVHQKPKSIALSPALKDWKEILQAALSPRKPSSVKLAMGTPMVGWSHLDIQGLSDPSKYVDVLHHWQILSQTLHKNGLSAFIDQFLKVKWKSDNLTNAERILKRENGLEYYQEFIHIGELLLEHQSKTNSGGHLLISFLDEIEEMEIEQNDALKYKFDPKLDAVNIMTTFASKGLEYDVVFTVGLNGSTKFNDRLHPSFKDNRIVLIPTVDDSLELEKHLEETDAEKMRQLYVAMTRPRFRLYMPVEFKKNKKNELVVPAPGNATPMQLFLAKIVNPGLNWKELYSAISQDFEAKVDNTLQSLKAKGEISSETLLNGIEVLHPSHHKIEHNLTAPPQVAIHEAPFYMLSFTALTKHTQLESKPAQNAPHDFNCLDKNSHTLPSGADTGNLIHKLIETIPFNIVENAESSSELVPWVKSRVIGGSYKGWEHTISDIIYATFNCNLVSPFATFKLKQINPHKVFKEIEFLYPYDGGCLKGFVDCVIEHEGRSYILDWKTNWLGSSEEDYSNERLDLAMQENQYDLQGKIYTEAWKRYSQHVLRKPFEETFGGVFYLFVRGPGIYYFNPAEVTACKV